MDTELTITLPEADWALVDRALQQMPFGQVAPLFAKINKQIAAQRASVAGGRTVTVPGSDGQSVDVDLAHAPA